MKTYNQFITLNEELNLKQTTLALFLSLSPITKGQINTDRIETITNIRSKDSLLTNQDSTLNEILNLIHSNIESTDSTKFIELFNNLSSHMKAKYGYEVELKNISDLNKDNIKGMTLFELLGWLGSICLAICGLPQAWMSYKDKNSDGISWGFVLLWAFGEALALAYVYDKLDLPLILNYLTNILIVGVILYYKINPMRKVVLNESNFVSSLADCFEVSVEGYEELNRLINSHSGKISEDDKLVKKIFDIVITNNSNGEHKGPLNQPEFNKIEQLKEFIKTNE